MSLSLPIEIPECDGIEDFIVPPSRAISGQTPSTSNNNDAGTNLSKLLIANCKIKWTMMRYVDFVLPGAPMGPDRSILMTGSSTLTEAYCPWPLPMLSSRWTGYMCDKILVGALAPSLLLHRLLPHLQPLEDAGISQE